MKKIIVIFSLFLFSNVYAAGTVESLLGYTVNGQGVTLQVESGGCTVKGSFEVRHMGTNPLRVEIVRKHRDLCKVYYPFGVKILFSYKDLKLKAGQIFRISNPMAEHIVLQ